MAENQLAGRGTIIFISPVFSSFIRNDVEFLRTNYNVILNLYNWKKAWKTPIYLVHQMFFLWFKCRTADHIIISFGGYWSLLPVWIGKYYGIPVFIILNGTDCASLPEFNYGSLRKPLLKFFCKWSYHGATKLLPVSESLIYCENSFLSNNETAASKQGVKHFFPELKTPYQVIHNGIMTDKWIIDSKINREEKSFISVFSNAQFYLKGGDLIVEIAKRLPEHTFYIAGCSKPQSIICTDNVHFIGQVGQDILASYYNRVLYIFQLSVFEGFGCALCEGMLMGCVPIVSSVNMLPEIVGESGYVLELRDADSLYNLVLELDNDSAKSLGEAARNIILTQYTMGQRESEIRSLMLT